MSDRLSEISEVMGSLYEARSILQLIADREGPNCDDVSYVAYSGEDEHRFRKIPKSVHLEPE